MKPGTGKIEESAKSLQNKHIKKILNEEYRKSRLSMHQLVSAIEEQYRFGLSYNTVANVLKPAQDNEEDGSTLNLYAVIALCRYFHLDTAYVLSEPGTASKPMPDASKLVDPTKFHVLDDEKYFGTFHGFIYSPNSKSSELIRFTLEIDGTKDSCTAKFTYMAHPVSAEGKRLDDTRVFYGTPIISTVTSNIFIVLTNDSGDFYFMYYDRKYFRKQSLFFRRGVLVTSSTIGGFEPLTQSFAMFSQKLPNKDAPFIRGLLSSIHPDFYITDADLQRLREINPVVEELYQKKRHIIDHDPKTVHFISESEILAGRTDEDDPDKTKLIEALLILKTASLTPSRVIYAENDLISKYAKETLLHGKMIEEE